MKFIYPIILLFLANCTTINGTAVPNAYGQRVRVLVGIYKDETGRLVGDCSGFENYMVEIDKNRHRTCIKIWNLEGL